MFVDNLVIQRLKILAYTDALIFQNVLSRLKMHFDDGYFVGVQTQIQKANPAFPVLPIGLYVM